MKTAYSKTKWVDDKTPISAQNLNKIEKGIADLYEGALGKDEVIGGVGIEVKSDEEGNKVVSSKGTILSQTVEGLEWTYSMPDEPEQKKLYLLIDPLTKKLAMIYLGSVLIFEA